MLSWKDWNRAELVLLPVFAALPFWSLFNKETSTLLMLWWHSQQVGPKSPHKHSGKFTPATTLGSKRLDVGASHVISLISSGVLMRCVLQPSKSCQSLWERAREKPEKGLQWKDALRKMGKERDFGHRRTSLAAFCWSCGTRWLELQTAWSAVAAESKLLQW